MQLLQRKNLRLKDYDYSQVGYYFITICINNKQNLLCDIVGGGLCATPQIKALDTGSIVNDSIIKMPAIFLNINIDQYIIMPNHVHLIIEIREAGGHRDPPLQDIIGRFKSYTTYEYNILNKTKGIQLWQRNYYEHVIRNETELLQIREYIANNPIKWQDDEYFN